MKKNISSLLTLLLITFSLNAQVTLKIEISELKNDKGHVIVSLQDQDEVSVRDTFAIIEKGQCHITFENLTKGTYAFKYIHDENKNLELDTNFIGFPKEGFGFSNDAKGSFGPPDFEDTLFEIQGNTTQKCHVMYLGK